jgi:hypothetical protein
MGMVPVPICLQYPGGAYVYLSAVQYTSRPCACLSAISEWCVCVYLFAVSGWCMCQYVCCMRVVPVPICFMYLGDIVSICPLYRDRAGVCLSSGDTCLSVRCIGWCL